MKVKEIEKISYNVSSEVLKAFEVATVISESLYDCKIRTAYVLLALLHNESTAVSDFFYNEYGLMYDVPYYVNMLLKNPNLVEELFGKEVLEIMQENIQTIESEIAEVKIETKNMESNSENEDLKQKVIECLEELVNAAGQEDNASEELFILDTEYSKRLEEVILETAKRCQKAPGKVIDGNNLMYSLLLSEDSSAYKMFSVMISPLKEYEVEVNDIIEYMEMNATIYIQSNGDKVVIPKVLEGCCEVYNIRFTKGAESEIVGRDKQKETLWNTFSKKEKKNAILIGPAGAGKTAIIEAITQDIVNETCPEKFLGYTVIEFNTAGAVAGTKYRGEFETKVLMLKKFIEQTPNVILFIDEIHSIVGAGSGAEDKNDLSGALKSTLARGDAIVVGTTTYNEYKSSIAKDVALKRRFNIVEVTEPKYDEVKDMIKLKINGLEKFHGVKIPEEVLDYIITVAFAFNSELCNPDKTITLCDSAMAIAENQKAKVLTKTHVNEVYSDNFEKFNKMSEETKKHVARHEAAHYVVEKLLLPKTDMEVVAISIVPGFGFLGANILESKEEYNVEDTQKYYTAEICSLLAGRAAADNLKTGGDNSDLQKAAYIAKKIITEFGMWQKYENLSFDSIFMSEQISDEVNNEIKRIITECYEKTRSILNKHNKFLESVTAALLEKQILGKKELDKLHEEYLKSNKYVTV